MSLAKSAALFNSLPSHFYREVLKGSSDWQVKAVSGAYVVNYIVFKRALEGGYYGIVASWQDLITKTTYLPGKRHTDLSDLTHGGLAMPIAFKF